MSYPEKDAAGNPILTRDAQVTKVGGTALTGRDLSVDLKVLTDLIKGALNADGVSGDAANVLKVVSHLYGYDPTGGHEHWDRAQIKAIADGLGPSQLALIGQAAPMLFNGASLDRQRGNIGQTEMLASAARTASIWGPIQTNYNHRGVLVMLDVTAIVDTPSITLSILTPDLAVDSWRNLLLASAAVTAVGTYIYIVYPGVAAASAQVTQVAGFPLPRSWRVYLSHADADSITYSVEAALIL